MNPLLVLALSAALLKGCRAPSADDVVVIPTPLLDAARDARGVDGLDAALPLYRRAADGGAPVEAGVAAVVLWDYHEARGDSAEATVYRAIALRGLGDTAWVLWASRPGQDRRADGAYAAENLLVRFERLNAGVAAGAEAARAERDRSVQVLEAEAAQGNAAAQGLLARVREEGLDRPAGA